MAGSFLPDTNVIIALFAGDVETIRVFGEADEVFLSSIVLGELYYGSRRSTRVLANVSRVDALAASSAIINCDLETARQYGAIKQQLRAIGKMIPENDIWIAAVAMQHELTLATRDAHFNEIEGISLLMW